jgi:hypothetical protein
MSFLFLLFKLSIAGAAGKGETASLKVLKAYRVKILTYVF